MSESASESAGGCWRGEEAKTENSRPSGAKIEIPAEFSPFTVRKNSGASEEGDNSAPGWKSEFVAVGTLSDGGFGGWRPSSGAKFDETRMSEAKIEILAEFSPITVRENFLARRGVNGSTPGRKSVLGESDQCKDVELFAKCWEYESKKFNSDSEG